MLFAIACWVNHVALRKRKFHSIRKRKVLKFPPQLMIKSLFLSGNDKTLQCHIFFFCLTFFLISFRWAFMRFLFAIEMQIFLHDRNDTITLRADFRDNPSFDDSFFPPTSSFQCFPSRCRFQFNFPTRKLFCFYSTIFHSKFM